VADFGAKERIRQGAVATGKESNMCPWENFEQGTVSFCEADLCNWIVHPADTFSNIGYLIVAIVLFAKTKKQKNLKMLPVSALCVAIGSTLFHATNTFWGEFLDVSSMYLFSSFLIARNLYRLGLNYERVIYWLTVALSSTTLLLNHPIGINLFTAHAVVFVLLELFLAWKKYGHINIFTILEYRPLVALYGVFIASFILWNLDIRGYGCEPDRHWFSWHSAWHLLNSWAFYYAYKFYKSGAK